MLLCSNVYGFIYYQLFNVFTVGLLTVRTTGFLIFDALIVWGFVIWASDAQCRLPCSNFANADTILNRI